MYICLDTHSTKRYLKKTAVPTCNLPTLSTCKVISSKEKEQNNSRLLRLEKRANCQLKFEDCENDNINIINETLLNTPMDEHLDLLTTSDVSVQVTSGDIKLNILTLMDTEQKLSALTGISSYQLLDSLIESMQLTNLVSSRNQNILSLKERILMTFMKLKQKMSYSVLAIFFNCSNDKCKRIILNIIDILSLILKPMIPWPSRTEIKCNIPTCFRKFSDTRIVIDCIEIPLMKPKNLTGSILTYSQYKSTYTAKFMTGITPGGILSFITPAYGGRTSDKFIFEDSKLIDKLENEDAIMCDKGFLIDNICAQRHIKLYRPPFLKGNKQLSKEESLMNVDIASARVHIERVNQRIKVFNVFQKYPSSLLSRLDASFTIICAIVNLSHPILANDKFVS